MASTTHFDHTLQASGDFVFLVGLAEGKVGYVQKSDAGGKSSGLYAAGRVKLYAKGRIQGRWLLEGGIDIDTSQLDSWRDLFRGDPQRIFRNLDPDRFYTVYGDASQTTQAAQSRARLYVRIQVDRSELLFGNLQTGPDRRRDRALLARRHRRAHLVRARRRGSPRPAVDAGDRLRRLAADGARARRAARLGRLALLSVAPHHRRGLGAGAHRGPRCHLRSPAGQQRPARHRRLRGRLPRRSRHLARSARRRSRRHRRWCAPAASTATASSSSSTTNTRRRRRRRRHARARARRRSSGRCASAAPWSTSSARAATTRCSAATCRSTSRSGASSSASTRTATAR